MPKVLNLPREKICEKYTNGMTTGELAAEYECHYTTILNVLHDNKIEIRSKLNLPIDQIIIEYQNGISGRKLGEKYECSSTTIFNILHDNKIEIRSRDVIIKCKICKKMKRHHSRGICKKCYHKKVMFSKNLFNMTTDGVKINVRLHYNIHTDHNGTVTNFKFSSPGGVGANHECSSYLGIYISEQVLSKIYTNVEKMPYGHQGYDFICGKGHKIDVKSSCLYDNLRWSFGIKRNTTADYFLCLGFDNRDDLNPQHIWLIPGNVINDKVGLSISKSTIEKWEEYEQPIDKVIMYCNDMKNNN
jgi:Mor family transcriptional regulator